MGVLYGLSAYRNQMKYGDVQYSFLNFTHLKEAIRNLAIIVIGASIVYVGICKLDHASKSAYFDTKKLKVESRMLDGPEDIEMVGQILKQK